jgi:MFS family permease
VWFPKHQQGTALGIFGMGNVGAAITAMIAPSLLGLLTRGGVELERWRLLPRLYASTLVVTTVLFWLSTFSRKPEEPVVRSLGQRLEPLWSGLAVRAVLLSCFGGSSPFPSNYSVLRRVRPHRGNGHSCPPSSASRPASSRPRGYCQTGRRATVVLGPGMHRRLVAAGGAPHGHPVAWRGCYGRRCGTVAEVTDDIVVDGTAIRCDRMEPGCRNGKEP